MGWKGEVAEKDLYAIQMDVNRNVQLIKEKEMEPTAVRVPKAIYASVMVHADILVRISIKPK